MRNELSIHSNDNHLIEASFFHIPECISTLDLEATKYKLILEQGWSLDKADQVEVQYKAFLAIARAFPDDETVPTQDIDEMWHTHILDTRKYMADCFAVFGTYLHHYPYLGLLNDMDKKKAEKLFDVTKSRFEQLGIDLVSLDKADCGGGGGGGCSSGGWHQL